MTDRNQKLYSRLYVACNDIAYARDCASQILKKGWHYNPWEKRGSVYFHQSVYTTALIVSYARPFTKSTGWPSLPERLLRYTEAERDLHRKLLRVRNKVYAHSDSESYSIRLYRGGSLTTEIVGAPVLRITKDEALRFLGMTAKGLALIRERMQRLRPEI